MIAPRTRDTSPKRKRGIPHLLPRLRFGLVWAGERCGLSTPTTTLRSLALCLTLCALVTSGCSRAYYRHQADADAYSLVAESAEAACTELPDFSIQVDPRSRMYDPTCPDHPPMPEDDPAAHRLMHCIDGKQAYPYWEQNSCTRRVDNSEFLAALPRNEQGQIVLSSEQALNVALINSPSYQSELEELYLSALDVSFERFRFDTQFYGAYGGAYNADGRTRRESGGNSRSVLGLSTSPAGLAPFPATRGTRMEKMFTTGSDLVVGLANSLVWQFSGPDTHTATTLLDFTLTQPLLRRAGRDRVLERLTIAERSLLSNVRSMQRFQRGYYMEIVTGRDAGAGPSRRGGVFGGAGLEGFTGVGAGGFGRVGGTGGGFTGGAGAAEAGGYMGLLQDQQIIRNQESTITSLRGSLAQLDAFFHAGRIDYFQVELARQALFNAQSRLLNSRAAYEDGLDAFKTELGLPPQIDVVIEDPMLDQFNLLDTEIVPVQEQITRLQEQVGGILLEALPPEGADGAAVVIAWNVSLADRLRQLRELMQQAEQVRTQVVQVNFERARDDLDALRAALPRRLNELQQLRRQLASADDSLSASSTSPDQQRTAAQIGLDVIDSEQLAALPVELSEAIARLQQRFEQHEDTLATQIEQLDRLLEEGPTLPPQVLLQRLGEQVFASVPGELNQLAALTLELALIQARARTEGIALAPVALQAGPALEIACEHRRDWQNARASLVDAWRLIQFNADDLESGLDVVFEGDLSNTGDNPLRLSDTTGRLRVGVQFDAPLTRLAERNTYRQALIEYQQARRAYYQFQDQIARGLRSTLRTIDLHKLNFELRRAAVQVAIAQVELTRLRLQEPPQVGAEEMFGATTARDLVNALADLLNVQNDFLSVWVNYEVQRRSLDFDLGTMQIDTEGVWVDPGPIGPDFAGGARSCDASDAVEPIDPPLPNEASPLDD